MRHLRQSPGPYPIEITHIWDGLENFRAWTDRSRVNLGETFSGVDFEAGVDAAREFAALAQPGATPAQAALRWVIQQPGVTTVIPGARNAGQARQNSAAADLPALDGATLGAIENLYDKHFRAEVHARW
jgi:aryl-alcohol dehydrogenase-like predicted oxidoreductase